MAEVSIDTVESTVTIEQLREMVGALSTTESGENLKSAMLELKKALRANPDACALMLPEDIGACVSALRRLTGQQISENANKPKGAKKPKIDLNDPAVEKDILDSLFEEGM